MDKDGFNHVDQTYQQELAAAKAKIEERMNGQSMQKQYVGNRQMQNAAKANDNAEKQKQIAAQVEAARQKIDQFHFGEQGGRNSAMEAAKASENKEKLAEQSMKIRQEFSKQAGREK